MNKPIVLAALLAVSTASAGDPDAKKPSGSSNVMKSLMRDAVDTSVKPPPDVTKLPFSQESIKAVIAYHQPQIQACYEETLASKEKVLEGKLLTAFVITGEGMVKDAKVQKKATTLKEPKLHECVISVLSMMTFPKPVDGRDHPIEFPFNLKAIQ